MSLKYQQLGAKMTQQVLPPTIEQIEKFYDVLESYDLAPPEEFDPEDEEMTSMLSELLISIKMI
jgi:hypothetical protein